MIFFGILCGFMVWGKGSSSASATSVFSSTECLNGAEGLYECGDNMTDVQHAYAACASVYGSCDSGSCGNFQYYYESGGDSCQCTKPAGSYEWIYENNGFSHVGQDYGGAYTDIEGNTLFVREKMSSGCSATSWELRLATLSQYAVNCPANTNGPAVSVGCECNAGYSGSVSTSTLSPFYESTCADCTLTEDDCLTCTGYGLWNGSTCVAAPCPSNSYGVDVAAGCTCNSGYSGSVTVISTAPFYVSTCTGVACPADSNGAASMCTCNSGYSGSVTPTTASPFYTSTCAEAHRHMGHSHV